MDLHQLEKEFVLQEDSEQMDLQTTTQRIMKFCKVDRLGYVIIPEPIKRQLSVKEKILLVLTARFVGSQLQQKAGKEVSIAEIASGEELAKILTEQKNVIQARAKDLKDERKILADKPGQYKIASYVVGGLLDELEQRIARESS